MHSQSSGLVVEAGVEEQLFDINQAFIFPGRREGGCDSLMYES